MADLAKTLKIIESGGLGQIPPEHAAKVVRRIVDGEDDEPRLDVAAFNSAS
jgi:FXSXX-COOH protein